MSTTADGGQGAGATCGSPAAGGRCTLRAAIELANHDSGDTIVVPAGVYGLDAGLGTLDVESSMTIRGAGPATTVVDGGQAVGVLGVNASPVAISGLTIRNGAVTGNGESGAGIANDGSLSLTDVAVTGGSAPRGMGGGIASDGPLTLTDVVVSGNHAGDGGGLALVGSARTTITRSTISGNTADGVIEGDIVGGRGFQFPGAGGGIVLAADDQAPPSLAISGSAISGNIARGPGVHDPEISPDGGGIFNRGAVLNLANDTVAGNTATRSSGVNGTPTLGGGISQTDFGAATPVSAARTSVPRDRLSVVVPKILAALESAAQPAPSRAATSAPAASAATTTLDFVTLANNGAELFGGISSLAGRFTVANSIVAGNTGRNCGNPGAVTSAGFNIESAHDCGFAQPGDQVDTNPSLGPLAVNAPGVTATMALLPGSPAIDAANPHCDQTADQRSVTRPQGPRCDIGAFEVPQASQASPPSPPVTGMRAMASTHGRPAIFGGALMVLGVLAALGAGVALRRRRGA